ncbi:MAG: rRNA maturation RNase YbeY [Bacteroidota bacterium]
MTTHFFYLLPTHLKNRNKLKLFIGNIIKSENGHINDLNIIFCSDLYLLEINKTYLHHNYFTDIITFDLSNNKSIIKPAEIYISLDRIRQNSIDYQSTIKNELHRVIFHGVLHLCGYKDKTKSQRIEIRARENFYLSKYFN